MMLAPFLLALGGLAATQEWSKSYDNPLLAKALLSTRTDGFRRDSIPTAVRELQKWALYGNISFDASQDQEVIATENLAQYDALLFVHTSGDIFDTTSQAAFQDYLAKGGTFAAVHVASNTSKFEPWAPWTETPGATFAHHPRRQTTTDLAPDRWSFDEEVYRFTSDPRRLGAKHLWSVDSSSYNETDVADEQGSPHSISWGQEYAAGATIGSGPGPGIAGRSFYSTCLGFGAGR